MSLSVFAEGDIVVIVDGTPIVFDTSPAIVQDRVFVPMRAVFEAFNCEVEWLAYEQVILAVKDSRMIMLKVGSQRLLISDIFSGETRVVETDAAPFIKNSRTLVPIRYISESLFLNVGWNEAERTVFITK